MVKINSPKIQKKEIEKERNDGVEDENKRGACAMKSLNNAHYHNIINPPADASTDVYVQPQPSVDVGYLNQFPTSSAPLSTSPRSQTLPRENSCSNCQSLERKIDEQYKFILFLQDNFSKLTETLNSLLSDSYEDSFRTKKKLQEMIRYYNSCFIGQQKMSIISEYERNKYDQKLKNDGESIGRQMKLN